MQTKTDAIAASAYNVCGPKTGTPASPSNVWTLDRATVLDCIARYADAHDGSLFTREQIAAAYTNTTNGASQP